jgi:hypothetical protein
LENNSRKPRDLTKNRHSASLGEVKKGDDVAVDDDDDDAVRTSISQTPK